MTPGPPKESVNLTFDTFQGYDTKVGDKGAQLRYVQRGVTSLAWKARGISRISENCFF